MIVRKTKPLPVECIVRGYLSGSGWKEYSQSQSVCGIQLPAGLKESDRLPEPIFTPSTKAEAGHDQNITFEVMCGILGRELSEKIKSISIAVYEYARNFAISKGIIIADTKMEFGLLNDELILIDELLTPDSSRFWPAEQYAPGRSQSSFDKQFLRDYLISIKWNQCPPAPELPEEVIIKTQQIYAQALRVLTS